MSTITVIDNEYATLMYYPDQKIVRHKFHKPIGGTTFRNIVDSGIALLQEHQAKKWLSDDRANSVFSDEDNAWIYNDWLPRAVQAGWKHWALIVPESTAARMNMKELVESFYERGVQIMVFTDPEEGMRWLERQ